MLNLTDLTIEAQTLGYGVNLGFRSDRAVWWTCAVFSIYRSENYKGRRCYGWAEGVSPEEALRKALDAALVPYEPSTKAATVPVSQLEIDSILAELDLK